MESSSTIRVAPAIAAVAVVRDFGLDPAAILTEAEWAPALLTDPDNIVPYAALGRLIEVAAARTACPHFGLLLAQKAGPSVTGVLGFASRHAVDVRSALLLLSQNLAHHDRGGLATFVEEGTVARLGYRVVDKNIPASDHITAASLAIGFQLVKVICGPVWRPLKVSFAFRQPEDREPYQKLFGDLVRFNAGESAISFAAHWLDSQIVGADPELQRVLLRAIDDMRVSRERNLGDEIHCMLAGMIGHGNINQTAVASAFGFSSRTLHRRLAALGTSFHDLVDEVRCRTACQLLESTNLPVAQIALMLGYSEASAFTRSFKRQLACAPAAWRSSSTEFRTQNKGQQTGTVSQIPAHDRV